MLESIPTEPEDPDPLFDGEDHAAAAEFPDPFEPLNRGIFSFNRGLDRFFFDPLTRAYGFIVPSPVKTSLRRAFANLNAPVVLVNDLLQLEGKDASVTAARLFLNTSVGIGGLFDPAASIGLEPHHSDFGQTLALSGVPSGPYIMLPLAGPTTVRDGASYLVDLMFQPLTYVIGPADRLFWGSTLGGGLGITAREAHIESLEALEATSIDYYAALRSAYTQNRRAEIWHRREHRRPAVSSRSSTLVQAETRPQTEARMRASQRCRWPGRRSCDRAWRAGPRTHRSQ
ncbi:MAG: VacJ family lipoprotein [Proteobacteria bacterium]|nr:VacJ family lipoprotein [Pseudomonadota bacterium]